MGKTKVNLGDKMRVKVNGERVAVPYRKESVATITRKSDSVLVETYLGVKVIWDGNSFLEVSVPTSYKGKMVYFAKIYFPSLTVLEAKM